jgi:hypothetical protein
MSVPLKYTSRVIGASAGTTLAAKGSCDMIEALVWKDGVCFFLSTVGVTADIVGGLTSFLPGMNATALATIPISMGCKTLVHNCKHGKLFKLCPSK